jgi:hypothetical protein
MVATELDGDPGPCDMKPRRRATDPDKRTRANATDVAARPLLVFLAQQHETSVPKRCLADGDPSLLQQTGKVDLGVARAKFCGMYLPLPCHGFSL